MVIDSIKSKYDMEENNLMVKYNLLQSLENIYEWVLNITSSRLTTD